MPEGCPVTKHLQRRLPHPFHKVRCQLPRCQLLPGRGCRYAQIACDPAHCFIIRSYPHSGLNNRFVAARPHGTIMATTVDLRSSGKSGAHATAGPQGQRFQYSGGHGERFGVAIGQYRAAAQHFPDGRARLRQEPVPLEHCRAADVVHHPRQQAWLHRAQEGN